MSIDWPVQLTENKFKSRLSDVSERMQYHPETNGQTPAAAMPVTTTISMKRMIIIGSSGSGKSTLARQLGKTLDLPVIHLDKHFWHPGWIGTPPQDWEKKVHQFATRESWIIDGNYRSTLDIRVQSADTVVFLDLPRWLCTWRATKRRFQYWHRQRPDIAEGCQEGILDPMFPRFLKWVWNYPNRARPNVIKSLKDLPSGKQLIWLRTNRDVERFARHPQQWSTNRIYLDGVADFFVAARLDG